MNRKVIIQIKKGEYLLDVMSGAVKTTYKRKYALDVSDWSQEQVSYIIENLKKVGYTDTKAMFEDEVLNNEV